MCAGFLSGCMQPRQQLPKTTGSLGLTWEVKPWAKVIYHYFTTLLLYNSNYKKKQKTDYRTMRLDFRPSTPTALTNNPTLLTTGSNSRPSQLSPGWKESWFHHLMSLLLYVWATSSCDHGGVWILKTNHKLIFISLPGYHGWLLMFADSKLPWYAEIVRKSWETDLCLYRGRKHHCDLQQFFFFF